MSPLAQLVVLLLVLVGTLLFAGLVYLVHRYPVLRDPLLVGLTGVAGLAALITLIAAR
ncbi:hypothetical protein AB0D59_46440 [Streptomyces sp. NPDC048417]|uniref:hypothetical protein n=1 Tax=Streptomyces sp. NPDC048417 TaxID=3155387 RepID=UPI0034173149